MSLTKRVIARIDVKGSKLIKGISFEGLRVIGDAREEAFKYSQKRIDEIFYTDAVASLYGRNSLSELLKDTSKDIFVPITAGGGIKSLGDGKKLLYSGADKLAINTGIVKNPNLINQLSQSLGKQCVIASIQVRKSLTNKNWEVMIESGREKSEKNLTDWLIEVQDRGVGEIFLTSVDKDGTAKGPDLDLIRLVNKFVKVPLVVGGGISSSADIKQIFEINKNISGVSIGWAFHKSLLDIKDVKTVLIKNNLEVRGFKSLDIKKIEEKKHVAVIDYGMGNVRSLCNAINKIGAKVTLTSEPQLLNDVDYWALPGVGAFPEGMKRLIDLNLVDQLKERAFKGKGIIGICLGMQLLFEQSDEYEVTTGLGILEGRVTKLPSKNNILPHVGWNKLIRNDFEENYLQKMERDFYQYFVHSYAVRSNNQKNISTIYEFQFGLERFIAAVKNKKTVGLQFHPERSGLAGLKLLKEILISN